MGVLLDNETDWQPEFSPEEIALSILQESLKQEGIGESCEVDIQITDGAGIRAEAVYPAL